MLQVKVMACMPCFALPKTTLRLAQSAPHVVQKLQQRGMQPPQRRALQ